MDYLPTLDINAGSSPKVILSLVTIIHWLGVDVRRPCGSWMGNFCSFSHRPRPLPAPPVALLSGPSHTTAPPQGAVEVGGGVTVHTLRSSQPPPRPHPPPPSTPSTCEEISRLWKPSPHWPAHTHVPLARAQVHKVSARLLCRPSLSQCQNTNYSRAAG